MPSTNRIGRDRSRRAGDTPPPPTVSGPQPIPAPPREGGKPHPAPSSPAKRAGGRPGRWNLRAALTARQPPPRKRAIPPPVTGRGNGKACGGSPAVNPRSAPLGNGSAPSIRPPPTRLGRIGGARPEGPFGKPRSGRAGSSRAIALDEPEKPAQRPAARTRGLAERRENACV